MNELKLHDAAVFLVAAGFIIPIAKRFRVSPVLGFLLVGLAVGPHGLARFADDHPWLSVVSITDISGVRALADLGIVFLLFTIGLGLSFPRLWALRRLVFGMGSAQIIVTAALIAIIARAFGNTIEASIVIGACLALSSTAIVTQLLTEQGRFGTPVGRGAFAVLLAQDIAVVPILFLVSALGERDDGSLFAAIAIAIGNAIFAIAIILGVGRVAVRPLFRFVSQSRSPELFMATTLLLVLATAVSTHGAGLSAALGAFLAGLLLAETEFRHEIEADIEPFKGLLLGLFFISVGMRIDVTQILSNPVWIALSVLGLLVLKALVMAAFARTFGFGAGASTEIGLLLGQGGEFAFVVLGLAASLLLLPETTAQFMAIVVGCTLLLTPIVARFARYAATRIEAHGTTANDSDVALSPDIEGHVVIIGYGRTGHLIAELLESQRVPHVALDLDSTLVARSRAEGSPVFLGDATRKAVLERLRLSYAIALVITTDDPDAAHRVLTLARTVAPRLPILVRAHDTRHATSLLTAGAQAVVPEVVEAGLHLGQALLERVGLPPEAARELVEAQRAVTAGALASSGERARNPGG